MLAGGGLFALGVVLFAVLWFSVDLPEDPPSLQSAVLVAEDGRELAILSQDGERFIIPLEEVNPVVVDALLSAEDRRFYDHGGVDPIGISRALIHNMRASGTQGGSTITQQLVKNEYLSNERSLWRKAREAVLSVKLEQSEDKDEILERYLNTVYFGRGAYGIEAAARLYFNTHAADLDAGQAALLVGMLSAPASADPVEHPKVAEKRRAAVLRDMVENDKLTQEEADFIEGSPIGASKRTAPPAPTSGLAPHFVEWVRQQVVAELGEGALYQRGLRVVTTLDIDAQKAAEAAVAEVMTDPAGPQAALVAIDEDGALRAHVGSKSYKDLKVDLVRGKEGGGSGRQPGSTFKAFVLQAALEDGLGLGDRFDAPPQISVDVEGQPFDVENYGGSGFGNLTLGDATKNSVNTVYAQLVERVGPDAVAEAAKTAGIDAELDAFPSIALGVEEVSPLDLASAFHTYANDGRRVEPYAIARIEDGDGEVLWEPDRPKPERAVDEKISRTVTEALRGVVESGTGEAANIGRPAAGKTGTTQENVDAWFAGYVPGYTAVTWVGHPEPTPMDGVTGGGLPAQMWNRFMSVAMEEREVEDFPDPPADLLKARDKSTTSAPSSTSTTEEEETTTTTKPGKGNGNGNKGTTTTSTTLAPTTTTVAGGTDGEAGTDGAAGGGGGAEAGDQPP